MTVVDGEGGGAPENTGAAGRHPPLACFVLLAKFLGIPADPEQIAHERGRGDDPYTLEDLTRVAKRLGLVARLRAAGLPAFGKLPLPALAETQGGDLGPGAGAVILLKIEDQSLTPRYLVQRGDGERPEIWTHEEAAGRFTGRVLLLTSREAMAGDKRPFDVSWFIPALVKYNKPLRDVLIGSFFLQLMGLVSPIFFQLVIDKVLVHQSLTTLDVLAIGLAVVLIFETMMSGLRNWLFAHTTNRVDSELSSRMFRHLLQLPLGYFEARRVGDSVARVRELERIREFLTSNAVTVVIDLFFTVVFFAVMYLYSPMLTLIVVLSIPCYVAISVFISPPLRAMLEEKFRRGAENQSFLVESVTGIGTLKAMAVEPQMRDRWEKLFSGYTNVGFDVAKLANWGSHLIQIVSKLTTVAILYFGARAVIAGDLSVGSLVAFNMLSGRVAQPVLRLSQLWQDFQQVRISVDRLGDVLNAPAEPEHNPGRASLPPIKGRVTFDKVRFRYRPDAPEALRGVELEIAAGEMLGIVGPSGSGKSTLTKLVQRLYVPEQGRVLVDGVDLALVDPAWLRRQVGVVLQENILFNRTVRENIALGDPTRPMEAVIAAAELAGAHEFILQLNHGYDTVIDERGGNLSRPTAQHVGRVTDRLFRLKDRRPFARRRSEPRSPARFPVRSGSGERAEGSADLAESIDPSVSDQAGHPDPAPLARVGRCARSERRPSVPAVGDRRGVFDVRRGEHASGSRFGSCSARLVAITGRQRRCGWRPRRLRAARVSPPDPAEVRLIGHSQKMTVAARATAEKKTVGHRSSRVATRRQCFRRPNIISMRLQRLYRRLSYLTGSLRDLRPGMQDLMSLASKASLNQSAS